MSSAEIYQKYKRSSFTRFVAENRESLNHFPASSITPHTHKAIVDLNGVIWNATDIFGGSIVLYPPSDRTEKYFVCLSDGSFHLEGGDSCSLYTQSTGETHRLDGKHARWIDTARFRVRRKKEQGQYSSLCMLESSDKMVIRFNEKTRCFLYTSGRIHLNLSLVGSMEFWSKSKISQFPFPYHIHSTRMTRHDDFMRYVHGLPPIPPVDPRMDGYLRQFNDGSLIADMTRDESSGRIEYLSYHTKLRNIDRPIYDQHDSFISFDYEPQLTLLRNMKVFVTPSKVGDIYPVFTTVVKKNIESTDRKTRRSSIVEIEEQVELSVRRERYRVGEKEYYVNGLYFPEKKDEIIAYFYLNSTNNHLLFILPYASASHILNTEPIPTEPQYSGPHIHVETKCSSPTLPPPPTTISRSSPHTHRHRQNSVNNRRSTTSSRINNTNNNRMIL